MTEPVRFEQGGEICVVPARKGWEPWKHFFGNDSYGVMATDTGGGYAISPTIEGRLINTFEPRHPELTGRCVYLANRTTGTRWNICRIPGDESHTTQTRFGPGWFDIAAACEGVEASLRVFVPETPMPAEIWRIRLTNRSARPMELAVYPYLAFFLGGGLSANDEPEWYTEADYLPDENLLAVTLHLPNEPTHETVGAFMAPLYDIEGCCTSRRRWVGDGTLAQPEALRAGRLGMHGDSRGERIVGVLEHTVKLTPNESVDSTVIIGRADSADARRSLLASLKAPGAIARAREGVDQYWKRVYASNRIETPDDDFNRWTNVWLKYQVVQSVRMGGGLSANSPLLGFRDMLQHAMGVTLIEPRYAKAVILEALAHQYASGRAVRQWSRHGAHDTRDYRDSPYWIVPSITAYLKETGDFDLLEQTVAYLDRGRDTVLGHMANALNCLYEDRGQHGLSHIGGGDWLDPLTACGVAGQGQSVWLTMALVHGLKEAAALYTHLNRPIQRDTCLQRARVLEEAIEQHGWNGQWYLRLYDDQGRAVGSHEDDRLFLNPQVWAVLSGCVPAERCDAIFSQVQRRLATPFGCHLFMPPWRAFDPALGNLSILQFHSVYSHANAFKIHADCLRGKGDEAYRTFRSICPDNPDNFYSESGAEPHIVPNGYRGAGHADFGRVLYSGFSGTFSWMLRGALEQIGGARADYAGLTLKPCLPTHWRRCRIVRKLRGSRFEITIEDPDGRGAGDCLLTVDGQQIPGSTIAYPTSPRQVNVTCRIIG